MKKRISLGVLLVFAAALPLAAQQAEVRREPRVLNVTGTGTVQRQPDRAVLMVAVESRAANAQQASQTNARKMEAVYAALRKLGIVPPAVQTVSYELHPEYAVPVPMPRPERADTPRVTGYVATNMVRVQIDDITKVGAVIDATIGAGANRIANLSFELRDPESARLEALRIAVQRARAEAEAVAAAAGERLGPPQSISSQAVWPQPQPMYRVTAEMAMAAPSTPIESGNLSIVATVNITYLLEGR